MKKKFLLLSLTSLACGFALAAVGCADDDSQSSSPAEKGSYTVTFVEGEGFSYEGTIFDTATAQTTDETKSITVQEDDTLSFSLNVGAFYAGTPVVLAGDTALASADGVYTVKVTADTTIKVNGIVKDVSSMVGTGAFDNAFVVSRPIDLLYIAERVNAGDTTYSKAAYVLGNDIDCKGEELEIIGDLNNDQAFFSGCFSCYTNSETGEMERYTISNFTINSDDSNYVGLFGCVQADLTTTSSGLFYGIRLDNFTINAGTNKLPNDNATVYCGSLIGYGVGVSAYLCDATNGEINVHADDNYFSFAGGLMGCQQGSYASEYGQIYSSEISYSTVDVDVVCVQGTMLYGGGVVAYAFTDSLVAPSFIHNAYSTGNISGAVRAGGIAGGLGQYTSVSNCYTTGNISASANQTVGLVSDEEYCYAYAGGLVGFAENDTIVNDCFTVGTTYARAVAGASYQKTGAAVGGGNENAFVSVNSQKYAVQNCLQSVTVDKVAESVRTTLGWREHDWTVTENAYPAINYEPSSDGVVTTVTLKFVNADGQAVKVNGEETNDDLQYQDTYAPLIDAFNSGELSVYLTADTGLLSYGYFFEDGTPVPYSYLTTRDVTLLVKFADPAPIVGTYSLVTDEGAVELELKADGIAHYTDGTVKQTANYQYDGKVILLESVKFAKFYTGDVDSTLSVNEDTAFDMNRYNYLNFNAIPENGTLKLYDGTYYTESKPLLAYKAGTLNAVHAQRYADENGSRVYYTFRADGTGYYEVNGLSTDFTYTKAGDTVTLTYAGETETLTFSALLSYDTFKGTWTKSTSVGKTYTFDGEGGWTYMYGAQTTRGGYTVSGDGTKLTLDSGETVSFTLDGFLCVEKDGLKETYYPANSFVSKWQDAKENLTLELYGLTTDGAGKGKITYRDGYSYELIYEPSATDGYICLYLLQTSGTETYKVIFGYFNATNDVLLNATLYDPYAYDLTYGAESGYGVFTLRLVDEYEGEWISGDELFSLIDFNGAGNFAGGYITIGDKQVAYELTDNSLQGAFTYNGVEYALRFDENGNLVQIISPDKDVTLQRKDELANTKFIGFNAKTFTASGSYAFNGAGNLAGGGKLTVTATDGTVSEYLYKKTAENGYTLYSEAIDETKIVGSLVKANGCYTLTLNDSATELYVENTLMGEWALGAAFDTLKIGPTDTDGYILGKYLDTNVKIETLSNTQLQFSCEIDNMPRTFYVFLLGDNDCLALTEYASLSYNDYTLCSRVDDLFGVWTMADKDFTVSFDGLSFPDENRYGYGTAHISYAGKPTAYNYLLYVDGTALLWSQELQFNATKYYKWIPCVATDDLEKVAYVNGDRAYKRVEVDSLYRSKATDANGVVYEFDGGNVNGAEGVMTASDGKTYAYKITAYANNKATLTVTDKATNAVYTATLDYSNAESITIVLEAQTTETA